MLIHDRRMHATDLISIINTYQAYIDFNGLYFFKCFSNNQIIEKNVELDYIGCKIAGKPKQSSNSTTKI